MATYYFAPFNDAQTDFNVAYPGYYLDTPGWAGMISGLGAGDQLAIEAHGNHSLHLCSTRKDTTIINGKNHKWNRAWIGPHQLWALINSHLPQACRTIIIQACHSIEFGRFFKNYIGGRDVWAFDGVLGSARWKTDNNPFTKV